MRRSAGLGAALAAVAALSVASWVTGAPTRIDGAARGGQPATRLDVPEVPELSAEQRLAREMFEIVNTDRRQRGLPSYEWHDRVEVAATAHSADMAANGRMQHAGSDGSNAGTRLTRAGFAWSRWGENIAAGFVEPEPLHAAWLASPGHRSQLLGSYRFVGVGVVASDEGTRYWTLVVAS